MLISARDENEGEYLEGKGKTLVTTQPLVQKAVESKLSHELNWEV